MSFSNYNPSSRYQHRARARMLGFIRILLFIAICGGIGFWFGMQHVAGQQLSYKEQLASALAENKALQEEMTKSRSEAQTANVRYEQIKKEFDSQMPEGPIRDLMVLVRKQLEEGMKAERLSFIVRSARPPTGCTDPQTKRFVVQTPAYKGPENGVRVADGAVIITGVGASAKNTKGQPEAWYDPAKKVSISFKVGNTKETKKGVLPIRHSVVVDGREYRFTIEEGARSFARVVFDSCAYP